MSVTSTYRGRFAPSPTGELHFGSLVAAVASYADALHHRGEWLVRIEDLDPTREAKGATRRILESLRAHGLEFPEPVLQSRRGELYQGALNALLDSDHAYRCRCSRKQLAATARRGRAGIVYPGTCRRETAPADAAAVRFRCAPGQIVSFADQLQGSQSVALDREIGDFLLRRGDRYFAYQLAVAADDHAQAISHVVRGTDLIDSTFMQLAVLDALGYQAPRYAHFPVVRGPDGRKLSKQSKAPPVDDKNNINNVFHALSYLNHQPPSELRNGPLDKLWAWVQQHWSLSRLCQIR